MADKEEFMESKKEFYVRLESEVAEGPGLTQEIFIETAPPSAALTLGTSLLWEDSGCLKDSALEALTTEEEWLKEDMRLEMAEHLSFCERCINRYTALLTDEILLAPLEDTAEAVERELAYRASVEKLFYKPNPFSRKRILGMGLAACAAMAIWLSGGFSQMSQGFFSHQTAELLSETVKSATQNAGSISEELTQRMWKWAVL